MTNRYETVFIMTPVLSDDQVKETVKKFAKLFKGAKAKMILDDHWGLRKLAYPIQKKSSGFYQMFDYEMDGAEIAKIEVELKRDERVLRFLTVKMDKHHAAFAESRKALKKEKAKEA